MRKQHIIAFFCVVFFVQVTATAHAGFTRLFDVSMKPRNNVLDCHQDVQDEIVSAYSKKWGLFRFDCKDGFIRSLYLHKESPIQSDLKLFIETHWKLFDEKPIALLDAGIPEWTVVLRRFGLDYHSGYLRGEKRPFSGGGGEGFLYDFMISDKIPSDFDDTPKTSRDNASSQALKAAAWRNHLPNHVEEVKLIISNRCLENWVPHLVWWVRIREADNDKPVYCSIDADSGRLCAWNGGCSSPSDPSKL